MKRSLSIATAFLTLVIALGVGSLILGKRAVVQAAATQAPRFEVDPMWPKPLPNHWIMGNAIGVSVDAQDHIWMVHRRQDWPETNHGITVDYKGNVWIGGNGRPRPGSPPPTPGQPPAAGGYYNDNMVLKFTQDGKFLMQIGKPGQSKGSNDTENLKGAAKMFVDPKTNELYVADGYGNHRVIVFDAETGKYKRYWGAYGHKPDDTPLGRYNPNDPPAQQFRNPVHCAELSNDGLLYVCDRPNDRIQVFKPDGTFVKEVVFYKDTLGDGSAWDIAFSKDPQQKYIFLADGSNEKIHIILRETMEVLTSFGDGGRQPGEFYAVHSIATDSKGNIFTTETYRGQRIQKFVYKGLAPVTTLDQGVVWPKK